MALITDVPNEILQRILDSLFHDSPKALLKLSQTCKKLHHPARRTSISRICLEWKLNKQSQLWRFASDNVGNDAVKSIRLSPNKGQLNAFMVNMGRAYDQMVMLCTFLSSLPNLNTFSINLEVDWVDRRSLFPERALADILRALPETVVNLELDTVTRDGIRDTRLSTRTCHLCHIISDMLPRLETISLRLSSMCPGLFRSLEATEQDQPTTRLRRALIMWDIPLNRLGPLGSPCKAMDCTFPQSPLSQSKLFYHLLDLQSYGAFPRLERFVLLSYHNGICLRDVFTRTLTQYPLRQTGCEQWLSPPGNENGYAVRFGQAAILPTAEKPLTPTAVPRDGALDHDSYNQGDYYGRFKDIENAVLQDVQWTTLANGSREPPTRITGKEMTFDTSLLTSKHVLRLNAGKDVDEKEWKRRSSLTYGPSDPDTHVIVERYPEDLDWSSKKEASRTQAQGNGMGGGIQMAKPSW